MSTTDAPLAPAASTATLPSRNPAVADGVPFNRQSPAATPANHRDARLSLGLRPPAGLDDGDIGAHPRPYRIKACRAARMLTADRLALALRAIDKFRSRRTSTLLRAMLASEQSHAPARWAFLVYIPIVLDRGLCGRSQALLPERLTPRKLRLLGGGRGISNHQCLSGRVHLSRHGFAARRGGRRLFGKAPRLTGGPAVRILLLHHDTRKINLL